MKVFNLFLTILWRAFEPFTGSSKRTYQAPETYLQMTEKELFESFGIPYRSPSELEEEKLKQYQLAKANDDWLFNDSDSLPE